MSLGKKAELVSQIEEAWLALEEAKEDGIITREEYKEAREAAFEFARDCGDHEPAPKLPVRRDSSSMPLSPRTTAAMMEVDSADDEQEPAAGDIGILASQGPNLTTSEEHTEVEALSIETGEASELGPQAGVPDWLMCCNSLYDALNLGDGLLGVSAVMVLVIVLDFTIAIVTAFALNDNACLDALGCDVIEDGATEQVNFLHGACKSAGIAGGMSIVRLLVKRVPPDCGGKRLWGVYAAAVYIMFFSLAIHFTYSDIAAARDPAGMACKQMRQILSSTDFTSISQASDWYKWLGSGVHTFLAATQVNAHDGVNSTASSYVPTFLEANIDGQSVRVWTNTSCAIRQLRTYIQPSELDLADMGFPYVVEDYRSNIQDTRPRSWWNGTLKEGYHDDSFVNAMDIRLSSNAFYGATHSGRMAYAGMSGQRLGGNDAVFPGVWHSKHFKSAEFEQDLTSMQQIHWIDTQTSMVQVICIAKNPSSNQFITGTYTVEFSPSGYVRPDPPRYEAGDLTLRGAEISRQPYFFLVYCFYYLNEELQDLLLGGLAKYIGPEQGWGNLIDYTSIGASFVGYIAISWTVAAMPKWDAEDLFGLWTFQDNHDFHQLSIGLFLILVSFKGIKFTKNIPIMARVGNTFGKCVVELSVFCIVLMILLLAFALAFNVIFCTSTDQFATLGISVVTCFLGLTGSMDPAEMFSAEPIMGPTLYAVYLFVVLFTAFTIVIAIISDGYEEVKDAEIESGGLVTFVKYLTPFQKQPEGEEEEEVTLSDIAQQIKFLQQQVAHQAGSVCIGEMPAALNGQQISQNACGESESGAGETNPIFGQARL